MAALFILMGIVFPLIILYWLLRSGQSVFGGPEARQRMEQLSYGVSALQARIRAAKCVDEDVLSALDTAETWLASGLDWVDMIEAHLPIEAYLRGYITKANARAALCELQIHKGHQLLNALGISP